MSTSQKQRKHKEWIITFIYVGVSAFTLVFGMIYEVFGHGVYSPFMALMFLIPLIGGVLPFGMIALYDHLRLPSPWARSLYGCGIATLTIGSAFRGVLDIYGTTSHLTIIYLTTGIVLTAAGILIYCFGRKKTRKSENVSG